MTDKEDNGKSHRPPPVDADKQTGAPPAYVPEELPDPTVVYRRTDSPGQNAPAQPAAGAGSVWTRELSPAIVPLIVGFLLLLILIFTVGLISVSRLDYVGRTVLDLEEQRAAKLNLLLKVRLGVTKLNNEARTRANADARRELKPPFDVRLNTARDDLKTLLDDSDLPGLTSDPTWQKFRADLQSFVEVTEDLRRYSLEGFDKFDVVDKELDALLAQSNEAQTEVFRQSEDVERQAAQAYGTGA